MKKVKVVLIYIILSLAMTLGTTVNAESWVTWHTEFANDPDASIVYTYDGQENVTYGGVTLTGAQFAVTINSGGITYNGAAFCTNRGEALPGLNGTMNKTWNKVKVMKPGDDGYSKKLATALYYGYCGDGDLTAGKGLSTGKRIALTAFAASYAKNGDSDAAAVASGSSVFAEMKAHIDAADAPDNVQYLYIGTYAYNEQYPPWSNAIADGTVCQDYQFLSVFFGYAPMGRVQLSKTLDTYESSYATVGGAEYGVYSDSDCTKQVGKLTTGADGNTNIIEVIAGTYYVKETKAPEGCRIDETKYTINVTSGNTTFVRSNEKVKYQIRIKKSLQDVTKNIGDAKLVNAKYGIYTDESCTGTPVATLTTNEKGETEVSAYLDYKVYYAKEISEPEGTILNETVYELDPSKAVKEGDDYVATFEAKDEIERGRVRLIKYDDNPDSSEKSPAAGAVLRLTLDSDETQYYEATVNDSGYAEFKNEEYLAIYPNAVYTIPYGKYTLTEVKASDNNEGTSFFVQPVSIEITENEQDICKVVVDDEPVPAWLKLIKIDKDTGKEVKLSGAKFKIWDVANSKWVELMETPSGEMITEFETNDEGYLYTPQELQPGTYVVYETQAPKGYYLEDDLRVPENEEDLGNYEVSGQKLVLDKSSTGLLYDAEYPEGGIETGSLVIKVKMSDPELKVKLKIEKKAEVLTGATIKSAESPIAEYEIEEDKYTPTYTMQGLQGVTYEIYAAEDIKSPDEQVTLVKKGTKVDTITTNEEGIATTIDLYPGEYEIKETVTPAGYLKDDNIPNVTLENEDQYVESATTKKELTNVRQKLQLTFEKVFEDLKYTTDENATPKALFGVYTKNAIKDYTGKNVVIPANKLVDLIVTDENNDVTSQIDLPEGTYVVRELYVTYPYTISTKEQTFELKYNNNSEQPFVTVEGEKIENTTEYASITLVKLSSAIMDNIVLNGDKIDTTELDAKTTEIINAIKGKTVEEIKEYFKENEISCVPNAVYTVYTDEECTKPLKIQNETTKEYEVAKIVTDESGVIQLNNVPLGEYWIQETKAPKGYALSDEKIKVSLDQTTKNTMVYQALIEEEVIPNLLTKTDIFTGEAIANCTFEIKDKETGEVKLHSVTNEEGRAYIPLSLFENGRTYTYTEISAPDIYDLNNEPHEFVAQISEDGSQWLSEKITVENRRKTRELIVRKTDADTGDPLEGCVFTIAMIDEETGEQKVNAETGEPIYLVKEAVTDENGEYVIEDAPMGTYKFTEIKAPEGYELDEDLTGYTFTINNDSPETIIFEVTNTGDIAVYALSAVALVSCLGIAYTVRKNKKQRV